MGRVAGKSGAEGYARAGGGREEPVVAGEDDVGIEGGIDRSEGAGEEFTVGDLPRCGGGPNEVGSGGANTPDDWGSEVGRGGGGEELAGGEPAGAESGDEGGGIDLGGVVEPGAGGGGGAPVRGVGRGGAAAFVGGAVGVVAPGAEDAEVAPEGKVEFGGEGLVGRAGGGAPRVEAPGGRPALAGDGVDHTSAHAGSGGGVAGVEEAEVETGAGEFPREEGTGETLADDGDGHAGEATRAL